MRLYNQMTFTLRALKLFLSVSSLFFFFSCSSSETVTKGVIGDHLTEKKIIYLDSEEGQKMFGEIDHSKFKNLKNNWRLQRKSFCGVCSAVIVTNTMRGKGAINQDTYFSADVRKIIGPSTVSKIGLTLRENTMALSRLNPGVKIQRFPSNISGQDLFTDQLEMYNKNKSFAIVNVSLNSYKGLGMMRGHFSVVGGYHKKSKSVLILEVNSEKHYWVGVRDIYTAMLAVDPISRMPRGWIVLTP